MQIFIDLYLEEELKLMRLRFDELFRKIGTLSLDQETDELQSNAFDAADNLSLLLEGNDFDRTVKTALDAAIWNLAIARKVRLESERRMTRQ